MHAKVAGSAGRCRAYVTQRSQGTVIFNTNYMRIASHIATRQNIPVMSFLLFKNNPTETGRVGLCTAYLLQPSIALQTIVFTEIVSLTLHFVSRLKMAGQTI